MCAACAMAAVAGASGVRAWLQAHHLNWLTEARMRAATITLFVLALVVSTVAFSGSSPPTQHEQAVHHAAQAR